MDAQAPYIPTAILTPYLVVLAEVGFEQEPRPATQRYPYLAAHWPSLAASCSKALVFVGGAGEVLVSLAPVEGPLGTRWVKPRLSLRVQEPAELAWLLSRTVLLQQARASAAPPAAAPAHPPASPAGLPAATPDSAPGCGRCGPGCSTPAPG